MLDRFLQMRHQDEVTRLEPVIMQCVMVHMRQNSTRSQAIGAIMMVYVFTEFIHDLQTSDFGFRNFTLK